jgi:hypothetical protein
LLCEQLSAGSLGCGDDFLEARIAAQIIPERIEPKKRRGNGR